MRTDTLGAYAELWPSVHPRSKRTNNENLWRIGVVLAIEIEGIELRHWLMSDVRRRHTLAVQARLLEQGRSAEGATGILRAMSAMTTDAIDDEICESNPWAASSTIAAVASPAPARGPSPPAQPTSAPTSTSPAPGSVTARSARPPATSRPVPDSGAAAGAAVVEGHAGGTRERDQGDPDGGRAARCRQREAHGAERRAGRGRRGQPGTRSDGESQDERAESGG